MKKFFILALLAFSVRGHAIPGVFGPADRYQMENICKEAMKNQELVQACLQTGADYGTISGCEVLGAYSGSFTDEQTLECIRTKANGNSIRLCGQFGYDAATALTCAKTCTSIQDWDVFVSCLNSWR